MANQLACLRQVERERIKIQTGVCVMQHAAGRTAQLPPRKQQF